MSQIEWITYIAASAFYAVSAAIYVFSVVFKKEHWLKYGATCAIFGLVPHSIALLARWIESGHGPYYSMYEVFSSYAWVSVVLFLLSIIRTNKTRFAGLVVMPVSFILMGLGFNVSMEISTVPPSLNSFWLVAHVGFAKLGFGSILIATGMSVLHLLKEREPVRYREFFERFPPIRIMDDLSYQFVAVGFIFLTIMVAAGAIWADQTWGRYWGWDPIEIWSLISWLVYGVYLHLRMNVGWGGKRAAWLMVFNMVILIFSLFATGIVYDGLHSAYMT
ncbi:MAG: c-type cytochrome biogenesis protein CcsB [ANME-2 cluster archaeon]|nr:c-type cytochrome biogenesis protein CcsB [ANME-2 cluster archaeon]